MRDVPAEHDGREATPTAAPGAGFRPVAWASRRRMTVRQLRVAAILVGGACGALGRAGLAEASGTGAGEWPWGTFVANQLGAFVLAWVSTELAEVVVPSRLWRPLLGTGLCGALTTFSAFQVETIDIAAHGRPGLAVAYAVMSIAVGMTFAIGGTVVARRRGYG